MEAIAFLLMSYVIVSAYLNPAPQQSLGEVSRIFYFHVPVAWVSVLAFLVSMLNSIRYLKTRDLVYDVKSSSAAQIGLLFAFLATTSGSIWASVSWGSYWNWDPRQVSIFILLLIYGAYFALRSAIMENEKKPPWRRSTPFCLLLPFPFLIFVIPRVFESLHPATSVVDENLKITMSPKVSLVFSPLWLDLPHFSFGFGACR